MINKVSNDIKDILDKLIEAENTGKSEIANSYLSKEFIAITRSKGFEENREKLIKSISSSNKKIHRKLDKEHFRIFNYGKIVVVRSIVNVKEKGKEESKFRNIHIFEKNDGKWLCKIWQVTKLEKNIYEIMD